MTLSDPDVTIAPREDLPRGSTDYLREILQGVYPDGVFLEYHEFQLCSHHHEGGPRVWSVYNSDDTYVETLNLEAFRTVSELKQFLDEMVAYDPDGHEEWVNR